MKLIIASFDGSKPAERALLRAADLAHALDATLVVATIAIPPVPGAGVEAVFPGSDERLAGAATEALERAEGHLSHARHLLEGHDVRVEFVSDAGVPAERIAELAEEREADLIVVGVGETGFLERLLEGSVTDDLARGTRRDVLIVH
jgi:nucleotide-binding universal stress UspA family protein